ncbi:hypothetical protein U0070_027094 [Myodes glareolus]|uniref:C-type lectin domain-containing protein n=1 Tax=Myodes glareolus TaxID=447135 RepID=A0AAW0HBS2_MYOGA
MHEEEIYSSLQWESSPSEASQKCLSPSKCSGNKFKMCNRKLEVFLCVFCDEPKDFIVCSLWKLRRGVEYWVGVYQEGLSRSWFWQDGSSPPSDWLPTENQSSVSQTCGYLKDRFLFLANCSSRRHFICEKNVFRSCI